jgi:hypothetical protein
MGKEGFGKRTVTGSREAPCPKGIRLSRTMCCPINLQ